MSSFVNCGFTTLNDNMAIFIKNFGLLHLVIPHILADNTLFPAEERNKHMGLGGDQKKRGIYLHSSAPSGNWLHPYSTKEECY